MSIVTRCIAILVLFMSGCALDRPHPSKALYVLPASDLEPESVSQPVTLKLGRAYVAPPFNSRAFQYRVGEARYEPTYYVKWADDPGLLVMTSVSRSISSTGAFVVLDDGSGAQVPLLRLHVTDLYVDVRNGGAPRVVLAMLVTMLDTRGNVLMTRETSCERPSASEQPSDVVDALGACVTDAVRELIPQLQAALGGG